MSIPLDILRQRNPRISSIAEHQPSCLGYSVSIVTLPITVDASLLTLRPDGCRLLAQKAMRQVMRTWSHKKFKSRFIFAAAEGCLWDVELSFSSGRENLLTKDPNAYSHRPLALEALCFASQKSHAPMVRYLISKGVDVEGNLPTHEGPPPLPYIAWAPQISRYTPLCASAEFARGTAVMQILLEKGAQVNFRTPFHGRTPLQCAIRSHGSADAVAKVRLLLQYGADPATKGRDGEFMEHSALHSAASRGHTEIVELLLDNGAEVDEWDAGYTPLMRTCMARHPVTARLLLLWGADPNAQLLESGFAPLALALLGDGTPMNVSRQDVMSTIKTLLDHGADVNGSPKGHSLSWAVQQRDLLLMDFLIVNGADVCGIDKNGHTLVERCIQAANFSMLPYLVARGADLRGLTYHHWAVLSAIFPEGVCKSDQDMFKKLMRYETGSDKSQIVRDRL